MTSSGNRAGLGVLGAIAATAFLFAATASAQPGPGSGTGPGRGPGPGMMMDQGFGPGMMMGPGMMRGRGMAGRMCNPQMAGFSGWRIAAIEQAIKPDEAQQRKLDEFKSASARAAETMRNACPAEFPVTPTARMEIMEKRMDAMLQAIRIVRPAFDGFYNSLTDEQKAKLNATSPGARRFWHWRDRW
jgi:hypothetical protein